MNLTEPVTIQKCTESGGSGAALVRTFADDPVKIWASIDYPGGREYRNLGQLVAEVDAVFDVRRGSGVTERDRLKTNDGLIYEVTTVLPQGRGPWQRIFGRALKP